MKNKKNKIIISISLLSALIISLIFLFSYRFFFNNTDKTYEKSIKFSINNILKINNNAADYIKGESIDIDKSKKELPEKISSLVKIKDKITSLNPSEKYVKSHEYLLTGLINNIHIYEQIISILNNPEGNDIDKSLTALKNYKNKCMQYYSLINIRNTKIALNENTLKYINNCTSYVEELANLKKDKEIRKSQYTDFINEMDEVLSSFIEIKINFSEYNDKIKNKSISYESVLNNIDNTRKEFGDLRSQFSKITVPSKGIAPYKLLLKTFDNYDSYLQNYRYALSTESAQAFNNTAPDEKLKALYIEANLDYKIMNSNYNEFIKTYSYFKENNK
ncbi:hypothetical protein [Clostridium lundense]|uniref:hypothetical protein n=1 Tax=Clostridium lundense TaxID=319475 RepID=UPI0004804677|nr:hypothetical protein [Clostridium lundense]